MDFTDPRGNPLVIKIGRGKSAVELPVRGPAIGLPLYEGRMIGQFDFSEKGWVSGSGRSAVWQENPPDKKVLDPQFIMGLRTAELAGLAKHLQTVKENHGDEAYEQELQRLTSGRSGPHFPLPVDPRVSFMDVTSATNQRTIIAAETPPMPSGNKVPLFHVGNKFKEALCTHLNSFVFDYVMRRRMCGLSVNYFIIEEAPLPPLRSVLNEHFLSLSRSLCLSGVVFTPAWCRSSDISRRKPWRSNLRLCPAEVLRCRIMLDCVCAVLLGISDAADLRKILDGCDYPAGYIHSDPKGFWRIDQGKDPELRHTVLTLVAFRDLDKKISEHGGDREAGIESFLTQNDGEGWLLPETVRLADYGLGHDDRALEHQPVAGRLGPRFFDWQLVQSAEESWRECHLHARNLLGEAGYQQLLAEIEAERTGQTVAAPPPPAVDVPLSDEQQLQLFS